MCAAGVKGLVRKDRKGEGRTGIRDLNPRREVMRERRFETGQEKGVSA